MKTTSKTTRKDTKFAGAYVEEDVHEDLAFIAAHEHRTLSGHIRKLIEDELEARSELLKSRPKPKRKPARK